MNAAAQPYLFVSSPFHPAAHRAISHVSTYQLYHTTQVLQAQQVKGKEKGVWMFRHKSLGLLAGILIAPRFIFRLSSKVPAHMKEWNGFEQIASKISHLGLYGFMVGMPVSGIAMG